MIIAIWLLYLLSGYFLCSESFILPIFLKTFSILVYPLSIFWLQIRIKNKESWLPFTDSMSTSQIWFILIPILASSLTFIIVKQICYLNYFYPHIVSTKDIKNVIM